ncbi:uncharacterized protein [Diadema antillarum]|uniref:uncharacterized protein n=1 Tax=Diadema antillarum TaxID=105358 RepID=UPI003A8A5B85
MPSRRKSAHTTKIERVPRYEAYHGEEDIDGDGTLDLSMKRIKVEPLDLEQGGNKVGGGSRSTTVTDSDPVPQEEIEEMAVVGETSGSSNEAGASVEEEEGSSATSSGETSRSNPEAKSAADDAPRASDDASDGSDHVTSQVDALGSIVCATPDQQFVIDANGKALSTGSGLSLFRQSSKGKSMRPFKLYTSSRDLLSGLAQQSGTPSLAAYSVPIALAQVAGAPGTVPLAFASPTVTGVPMIPITAQSSTTAASSTAAAMGAGTATTSTASTSSATTNAKSTSSTTEVHLMTLATEADKILRERHASGESDAFSADSNSGDNLSNGESVEQALVAGEEGTVLKIPSLVGKSSNGKGEDSLTLIQKRAVAAAVAAANPQKSKKRRQALPEDLKDNAYWERRRKNNEAAKRSRDARRAKEDQIAIRAALLEQENIRLKIEVTALKEETARLRAKLYGNNNC